MNWVGKLQFTLPPNGLLSKAIIKWWMMVDRRAARAGRRLIWKGKAGLRSEQTCEIFLSLLKNGERRQRAGVKSSPGWTLVPPVKEGHALPNPHVLAANTTKVAVAQHFSTVSCCRSSTFVISSDSYSLSETGPSYFYKLLSEYLSATGWSLVFVNYTSNTSKYYKQVFSAHCHKKNLAEKAFPES